jgi:nucleotide-binding universal stress UspA family protein
MEHVLIPLDGSSLAEAVLPVAESLGRQPGGGVRLIRAVAVEAPRAAQDAEREEAGAYLVRIARQLETRGLRDVRWGVWDGEPEQVVVNAAVRERATLIAMGTHGRSGLDRVRFGSVAEGVARRAPVPVLLVRSADAWRPVPGATILVPPDGSRRSEAVLPAVERLMVPFRPTVALLHAVEPAPTMTQADAGLLGGEAARVRDAEQYLREVGERLEARGLAVTRIARSGFPVEIIERTARELEPCLIAMSTHGRTGLGRLLLGSVAEQVARSGSAPVLLWRAPSGGARTSA